MIMSKQTTLIPEEQQHQTQADGDQGEILRDQGLARVYDNNRPFVDRSREIAEEMALDGNGCVWSDDLRRETDLRGIYPEHPNAYGSIFHSPKWIPVDSRKSTIKSAHARQIRCWKLIHIGH
jgi:hypothetical protein